MHKLFIWDLGAYIAAGLYSEVVVNRGSTSKLTGDSPQNT